MTCRDCRFMRRETFYETCHRYAARPILIQQDRHVTSQDNLVWVVKWPVIENLDEECGDFAPTGVNGTEPHAQAPIQPPEVVEKPPEKLTPPAKPLPTAKAAVEMVIEYLTISVCDYDESALIIDKQTLSGSPEGKVWRIEARYDENDYNFIIGPDGIVEMF